MSVKSSDNALLHSCRWLSESLSKAHQQTLPVSKTMKKYFESVMPILALLCIPNLTAAAESLPQTIARCAPTITVSTMARIIDFESGGNVFAIQVNGPRQLAYQPGNREDAIRTAQWLIDQGYDLDLGLGQINVRNLKHFHLSVADAFDDCKNLSASAALLSAGFITAQNAGVKQPVLTALSYYNTGNPTLGFRNGYVDAVLRARRATPTRSIPVVVVATAIDVFDTDGGANVYRSDNP